MQEITIKELAKTRFKDIYMNLLRGHEMSDGETVKLLAIAVLLLNHSAAEIKRLGYRITLFYGNLTGRYEPLYDVAVNSGLLPVSAAIGKSFEQDERLSNSFIQNIVSSYVDTFRDQGMVLTEQQDILRTFVQAEYENSSVVVAPTSYGKSELIIKSVRDNPEKRVLILVPSKALLAQTKKRLIYADINDMGKVITHPEMYSPERNSRVFVLTQERLNRMLNEHNYLKFDMVFVDEAHNLLQGDSRNELLATMLCILGARNPDASFKFLTPFLCNELNVRVRYLDMTPKGFRIDEYIKSERFLVRDFRTGKNDGKLKLYDHFLNHWIDLERKHNNCFDLIKSESLAKNIIYGNTKKRIEQFALELAESLPNIECPLIQTACDELEETFDKRYRLIACLRKGVMYHHGSIPDTIRLYLENLFNQSKAMKYLVCNSTLLEGVNLPIERLFIFDYSKGKGNLTSSQFKNLIGRVNRFSEVFDPKAGSALQKLESSIYLLGVDEYTHKRANLKTFYENSVNVSQEDEDTVTNVLLQAADISDDKAALRHKDAVSRLENLQPGVVTGEECKYVKTEVGRLMIANSVSEIDVFASEEEVDEAITLSLEANGPINTADRLLTDIKTCFIEKFHAGTKNSDMLRLKNQAALDFYAMFLDWKLKKRTTKQIIRHTLKYWEDLPRTKGTDYVFVSSWGDTTYRNSHSAHYVRISRKNEVERVNLAIVRLKDEDDFFDNKIFRFLEILNGVGAVEPSFYKRVKYGTDDESKIKLIREGYSRGLSELLLDRYPRYVRMNANGEIEVSSHVIALMRKNEESDLLIFEAQMNLKPVPEQSA
ncbi:MULTISPECIES: DEAD/DEAH box helicase [Pseudomonas]|uniref:DEAD/DEAH box helicase n=1 Tax=Pseudomonas TaxID=286 RepID=UPI001AAFA5A6|nr:MULTISPECIES: DEAD/DEAH box helicase [Pseudomonas]MBO2889745.1 DEAD/DEAH box helicase [Pseudomonas asiatica]MCK2120153.1 DEAD/DEAH box helicase [Pseudomonas sp. PNPG3]